MTVKTKSRSELVTRAEYEALLDRIEEVEDALRMRAAEARGTTLDAMPADLVKRMLAGEHPLRLWREHRGLTRAALAERAELPPGYLSEIENGDKPGSVEAYRRLARALEVTVNDLMTTLDNGSETGELLFSGDKDYNRGRKMVRFYASYGRTHVRFAMTRRALEERFGLRREASEVEAMKLFESKRTQIEQIARKAHQEGVRRRDGYIVIDSDDA
jgi:transcriptional regulator with XRE-family HTH domain